jgi:outer membrane protein insertion porin family
MRRVKTATVLLLLGLATSALAAENRPIVREIRILNLGAGPIDEAFVVAHTAVHAGAEMDRARIAQDVKQLLATGRFSDVGVDIETVADGVRLLYRLRSRLKLDQPLRIVGARHFSESKVRDLLGLVVGDPVDDQILGARAQKVLAEYRADSYPEASLTWNIQTNDFQGALAAVTATVNEGPRARLRRVTFSGNKAIPARDLRQALNPPAWWNVFRWFSRDRYERDSIEQAPLGIRDQYLDWGYLDVEVDGPTIEKDAHGGRAIHYAVREGPAYRFGTIRLTGVTRFAERDVSAVLTARTGGTASRATMERAAAAVRDFYGSRGYVETRVEPVLTPDPARGRVDVEFAVTEGTLVHIRNVLIRGNTRTRDRVIRREVLVMPGEVFNEVKVRQSERIISNLGFFKSVHSEALRTDQPARRDMLFDVEETTTGQFMVGMGFSSVDRMTGFASLSQGNFDINGWPYFTGGGQKLRLSGELGSRRAEYGISFVEPWFLNRKLSLGVDLNRSDVQYSDYDIEETGGGVTVGRALPGANRLSIGYRLARSAVRTTADTNVYAYLEPPYDPYTFPAEESETKSTLTLTLTHDTRNRTLLPSSGNLTRVFGRVSGGPLGFDTDLYGLGIQSAQYVPLWLGHVLNLRARWEVVDRYGRTEEVSLNNRLFIGGGRTIRGYDYRDVGPKVVPVAPGSGSQEYRAVGGQTLALAKADYTVPIVTGLRLAAFFDIGNVWRDAYDFSLSHLASSAGCGIRLDIPNFPVAIDRAWPIRKDNAITDEDSWVFWIGPFDY